MPERMTRRRFVHVAGVGTALGVIGENSTRVSRADDEGEKPVFRFLQWNDVHIDETEPPGYQLANEKMKYLVDWANEKGDIRPDLVVGVGDMVHGGALATLAPDTQLQKELLAGLKVAFYPVIGNHENVQQEGAAQYEAAFSEAFGEDRINYTLKHKGLLFVMLNNSGAPMSNSKEVGRRRNDWLRGVFEKSAGVPKIVCCHIPLIPIREESVLAKSFGFVSYAAKDSQLLGLVDEHAESIVAVLSGHLHLTGVVVRKGVHHVSVSGTASYPCDFACFDVFPDRIRMRIQSLPEGLQTPDTNIHGSRRHKVDFTDATHSTAESYVGGNPSERDVELAL
jgi:calcineurin-like phosphoesterase family protein